MEAVNSAPVQSNAPAAGAQPQTGKAGEQGMFGAILAQLKALGGDAVPAWMQPGGEFPLWGEQPNGEQLFGQDDASQDDSQAQLLAMQLLAQGIFALPQNLIDTMQTQQSELLLAAQGALAQPNGALSPGIEPLVEEGETQQGGKANGFQSLFETLSAAWGKGATADDGQGDMTEAMRYQNALHEMRQALSEKSKGETEPQQLDIEALQGAVNDRRFLPQVESGKGTTPSLEDIASQVKTGIMQNIKQGKSEFVIRLKPEGLGEITIRLSEEKDKISLSIITSSSEVGKLISNEVTALQNALRPLHAEVKEITVIPAPAAQSNAAQASMTNDPGNGRQFAGRNREDTSGMYRSSGEDRFDNTVEEVLADSGINILV